MNSSSIFDELTLDKADEEIEDYCGEFIWRSQMGIKRNIRKLNDEFNNFHGLKPIKICISGPPASGKSFYAGKLSQMCEIPHIKISDVVELAHTYKGESGDEIRKYIDSKKDETMEEFEKSKKKGQELSRDEIVVRLSDQHTHTLTKVKLFENSIRNKGFILDGFPKSYTDCYHAFYNKMIDPDQSIGNIIEIHDYEENNQPADWKNNYELDSSILPKIFIHLTGTPEEIKVRVKGLPEDKTAGSHWDDAGLERRNQVYNQQNTRAEEGEEDKKLLIDFFNEHKVHIIHQN